MNIKQEKHTRRLSQHKEAQLLAKHISEKCSSLHGNEQLSDVELLKNHLLFISVTFKPGTVAVKHTCKPSPMRAFSLFYRNWMADCLGGNIARKRHYQPLTWAFVDVEGSRQVRNRKGIFVTPTQRGEKVIDPRLANWPHVHALSLIDSSLRDKIQCQLAAPWLCSAFKHPGIDVEASWFDPSKSSLVDLISYCSKGMWQIAEADRDDFLGIFPPAKAQQCRATLSIENRTHYASYLQHRQQTLGW